MSRKGVTLKTLGEAPAIGIDLGTTFSVVAVYRRGKVEVIANDSGSRTTPSVVGFEGGKRFVGEAAKDLPAGSKVFDAKRILGRQFNDPNIQRSLNRWPFAVVDYGGTPRIQLQGDRKPEAFAPEEISAAVLSSLKETAEAFLEAKVSKAVITVPAYFTERQRQATKDAGRIAGLDVIGMINEPTAAAIAFGLERVVKKQRALIYDLGGGTFDVSVMEVNGSDFTVIASDGDTYLGGQDFDLRLVEHFLQEISSKHGVDLSGDREAVQELRAACEVAKRKLSTAAQAPVNVFITRRNIIHRSSISRARFQDLCADLFRKTIDITTRVVRDAKMTLNEVDSVVLVGGSTRIPQVRALLRDLFGGKDILQHGVNPDEAVAFGAAVHAAMRSGDRFLGNQVVLKDVTPLSLGVNIVGGRYDVVIPRNSPIPCQKTKPYYTVYDQQNSISVKAYQGERPLLKDNHYLNKEFVIAVPPRPAGQSSIETTMEIDCDGLLTVSSVEPTTGERRHMTVTSAEARLAEDEVQRMIKNSLRFKEQDLQERARIENELRRTGVRI